VTESTTARPIRQHDARRAPGALFAALAVMLLAASPVWLAPTAARAEIATQYQVETDLTCQCGCGLTVHSCNHLNCGSGIPLKKEIGEQIAAGKSREEILGYFTKKYGEKILSSPTTTGFNIAAWTVPFVVIALGGLIIGVVLVRWRRSTGADSSPVASVSPTATDPDLKAKLERELADLDRRS
jgi:cytochrome c-type biogenesis protein CcmH